jgi:predicted GIY-YIG superfamily endonuclease
MSDKCTWPLSQYETIDMDVLDINANWNDSGGIYIFAYVTEGSWQAAYVGQTNNFKVRLLSHDRWRNAVGMGATHVHAVAIDSEEDRDRVERQLIQHLQPPLNQHFR